VSRRVLIVGAGLTGLAAAWRLTERGVRVEVAEAEAGPGGLLQTIATPHGLVERAANAFASTDTVQRLFHTLDLTPVSASAASNRRYIYRDGRPRRWPLTPLESLTMASRGLAARVNGGLRPMGEESVATWSDRAWGRAATQWLISPGLQGIYGAPADRLAAAAVFGRDGSRLPAGRKRPALIAPPKGMGELIDRLVGWLIQRGVAFSFGTRVESLDPAVPTLICTNARAAARLVQPHAPALGATLQSLPMSSLVTATAFFDPHRDDIHGFGVLFPRDGGVKALGVLFNADIFAGRSTMRSETWISASSDDARSSGDDDIARELLADREVFTGRAQRPLAIVATTWAEALPIYGQSILRVEEQARELPPWLRLAGNYLGRLGVSKILDSIVEITAAWPVTGAGRA
jgi:oxygen-dependent protoporphyrinogen oxidase